MKRATLPVLLLSSGAVSGPYTRDSRVKRVLRAVWDGITHLLSRV
jgi:hypothetical protein